MILELTTRCNRAAAWDDVAAKLDDVAEETLDIVSSSIDELAGKNINKGFKEGVSDGIPNGEAILENTASEIKRISSGKGSMLTWAELQAFWKRGNDFNNKRLGDYQNN